MSAKVAKRGGSMLARRGKTGTAVAEKLRGLKCDPFAELAKLAMDSDNPPALRVRCLIELAQYVLPKKRATSAEHVGRVVLRTHEEWLKLLPE